MAEALGNGLPSGYDGFMNEVEPEFLCLICHLAMKETVITRCGHRFCNDCLEEHFRRQGVQGQPLTCPADRESLDRGKDVFPEKATERKILSLAIKCPNEGCEWTDELRRKEIHLASCLFKFVSCTNENCHETALRKDLEQHVTIACQWRIIKCKHCSESHPHCKMQIHLASCPFKLISCTNENCHETAPRKDLEQHVTIMCQWRIIKCEHCSQPHPHCQMEIHLASCPFKLISCTNENCHVRARRKDLEQHVTIMCQWRIIKCEHCSESHPHCQIQDHIAQCSKFPVTCPNKCGGLILRELIPDHIETDCQLTIISCPYAQMGCETKITRKQVESHLQSAVRVHLDLACVKLNKTEVKLNKTEDKLNNTEVKLEETKRKLIQKLDTLERKFKEKVIKDQENVIEEKTVTVRKDISDFPRMFIWKINDFSEILRQAKNGKKNKIESDPFYTASYGYKLIVKVYPNGDQSGKNTHLSMYIFVMKGEYDAILPWPFKNKMRFTLIDQQDDPVKRKDVVHQFIPGNSPNSFARPTKEQNIGGTGSATFISHEKLHSRCYLVDDTLFLQVEVGPSSS